LEDCFAKTSAYARRVQEVKTEILEKKGIAVEHVIMTSDERDESWWKEVEEQGWLKVNHSRTEELYGDWCVPFSLEKQSLRLTRNGSSGIPSSLTLSSNLVELVLLEPTDRQCLFSQEGEWKIGTAEYQEW